MPNKQQDMPVPSSTMACAMLRSSSGTFVPAGLVLHSTWTALPQKSNTAEGVLA